jgi:hypothetical protein
MSILSIATAVGMVGDLYWTEGGLIDRATACLLLNYTIVAEQVRYSVVTGERYRTGDSNVGGISGGNPSWTLLRTAFQLNVRTLTVISDGKWVDLRGGLVENGRAVLGNEDANIEGANILVTGHVTFSAEATEKLGLTMEDVGRRINVVYRDANWQGLVQQVFGNFSYADNEMDWMGIGRHGAWTQALNDAGDDGRLWVDLDAAVGGKADLSNARLYINYRTNTIAGLNAMLINAPTHETAPGYGLGDDGLGISGNHGENLGNMRYKMDESKVRVIWNTDARTGAEEIRFIFVEFYQYSKFRDEHTDGGHRVMRLHEVFDGKGRGFGHNARLANIYGYAGLELKENDRFLAYQIGTGKFGVRPIDSRVVEGRVTNIFQANSWEPAGSAAVVAGRTLQLTETLLGSSGQVAGSMVFANQPVAIAVTQTGTFYMFNGKVAEIALPEVIDNTSYAIVERSQVVQTASSSLAGAGTLADFVRLRFEDNSTAILRLTNGASWTDKASGFGQVRINDTNADGRVDADDDPIDGRVFHYVLGDDDTVRLIVPAAGDRTGAVAGFTILNEDRPLSSRTGRLPGSGATAWPTTALNGRHIVSDTVTFVQTGGNLLNGFTFRAAVGSIPGIGAGPGDVIAQYQLMNISGFNLGGIAFLRLMGADMVPPPPASWAVSLGAWRIYEIGTTAHYQIRVLTSEGNVQWLSSRNTENYFAQGQNVTPRFTVFNYRLNDDGFVAGMSDAWLPGKTCDDCEGEDLGCEHDACIDGSCELCTCGCDVNHIFSANTIIRRINATSNFITMHNDNTISSFHPSTKFYIIDGENSRALTATEAAAEIAAGTLNLRPTGGTQGRQVKMMNVMDANGNGAIIINMSTNVLICRPAVFYNLSEFIEDQTDVAYIWKRHDMSQWDKGEEIWDTLTKGYIRFRLAGFDDTDFEPIQFFIYFDDPDAIIAEFDFEFSEDGWYWFKVADIIAASEGSDFKFGDDFSWFGFGFQTSDDGYDFANFGLIEAWLQSATPAVGTELEDWELEEDD